MANKLYDFIPAHLRNKELEDIFEASLERVFSKGNLQKERAFVGRRERGINETGSYLSFPPHLFQRDNYGFEPVFENKSINDRVFYDDLLNAMYNKGMLINDHRRLFKSTHETINLPINADMFVNWQMYYWVEPGFAHFNGIRKEHIHYVTVDRITSNWFGNNNSWYHYDDIREHITSDNKHLISQAQRPIIEFDKRLQVTNGEITSWEVPVFKVKNEDGESYTSTIFEYVQDDLYPVDRILRMRPKMIAGDYNSEFVFRISLLDGYTYDMGSDEDPNDISGYIDTQFNYRNLRREYGNGDFDSVELPQRPMSEYDVDVYVAGVKKLEGYSVYQNTVSFDNTISGDLYIDFSTKYEVDVDGDETWQRIDPIIEYNVDNESYSNVELTYSILYEHFVRQIETTPGIRGTANASNNYRYLGDGTDTLRFNINGSVMIRHKTDVKKGYFAITRDDYDPIKAAEFISISYSSYKNKLVLAIREILKNEASTSKTDIQILEEAITDVSKTKRAGISSFTNSDMLLMGTQFNHYTVENLDVQAGTNVQELQTQMFDPTDYTVILNGSVQAYGSDYIENDTGTQLVFLNHTFVASDFVQVREYSTIAQTFIPPSAPKLGIATLNVPETFVDDTYDTPVEFLRGHDGSATPLWNDRTDDIMLGFEKLIYNRFRNAETETLNLTHGFFSQYDSDYTFGEKRYMAYPFFKKWMIRSGIDNMYNTTYDATDWKTWNFRAISDNVPGSFRGIYSFVYNTEFIFVEPWKTLGLSQRPKTALFGWDGSTYNDVNFKSYDFWSTMKQDSNASWPIPVDTNNQPINVDTLFFNNRTSTSGFDKSILQQDWEFGDCSPEELAWRRSSEYPFVEFIMMILQNPFMILDEYSSEVNNIITEYNNREGYNNPNIVSQRENYDFKLGSKLGGFVNNLQIFSERNSLSNSSKSEIPSDNYNLFIHSGEPNRSESFSAIVLEKVSLDSGYPKYSMFDIDTYNAGDIVYRASDKKYYKRKIQGATNREVQAVEEFYFDYSAWILISQPKVTKFGYRVSGYDDLNPVFYTLDWDTSSPTKIWRTDGDPAVLQQWQPGSYYKLDGYVQYNNKAYVSLDNHQSTESFDSDLYDGKWKLLNKWPSVNAKEAIGYEEVLDDSLKSYNYGDIIYDVNEVAQLMVGYQEYLKIMGWSFDDIDEFGEAVDFESLLIKFLDWTRETHSVGDFITLTPIVTKGSFTAPYGVATIGKTPNKNYYRVVDSTGRQLSDSAIKFNTDSDGIHWESVVPVYGIKVDILDIEHAFTIDREDSYGDVIYDPLLHNRNLRILLDCNRTVDWDGTLAVDGYIASGNKLLPNLETMVEETRYYRDTIADQSLSIVNRLKESQMGFSPRSYLTNHFIERETQLEFYKGFLAGKGTKSSIDKIINNNSNFADVTHDEVWALKLDEYGKTKNYTKVKTAVLRENLIENPSVVDFVDGKFPKKNGSYRTAPIMTSGYVNPNDVNYVVRNNTVLENTVRDSFYEGDTAWIRFDEEREWDVKRLSEVSEINYVGETEDSQLYLGLTNEILDIDEPVFIKINSVEVDPNINGYYNLVDNGSREVNGQTVYEYLVFDSEYEPLTVEIDSTTDNSVFVPVQTQTLGITATGSISNPALVNGDELEINGVTYTFSPTATLGLLSIGGTGSNATPDPVVTRDEQARITILGTDGLVKNTNTLITFDGTSTTTVNALNSNPGDIIDINGTQVTIDYSSQQSISTASTQTETDILDTGETLTIEVDGVSDTFTTTDLEITGSVSNPEMIESDTLDIDGTMVQFTVPAPVTGNNDVETQTISTSTTTLTLSTDMTHFEPGTVTVSDGLVTPYSATYTYSSSTSAITLNDTLNPTITVSDWFVKVFDDANLTYTTQDITDIVTALENDRNSLFSLTFEDATLADTIWDAIISLYWSATPLSTITMSANDEATYLNWIANNVESIDPDTLAASLVLVAAIIDTGGLRQYGIIPISESRDVFEAQLLDNSSDTILTTTVLWNDPITVTIDLIAQAIPQTLSTQDIVDTINSAPVPVEASIINNKIKIETPESYLRMQGSVLNTIGLTNSLDLELSKFKNLVNDINASNVVVTSYIDGSTGTLEIETTGDEMILSGTLSNSLGFPAKIFNANANPTAISVVNQINALSFNVSAITVGNKVRLVANTDTLTITEVTQGAMSRFGFNNTIEEVSSIESIKDQINAAIQTASSTTEAVIEDRRIKITTDQASISLVNVSGNPWNDIGIAPGVYNNNTTTGTDSYAKQFVDIINASADNNGITASTTSDNRMSFTSNGTSISFSGSSDDILTTLGLRENYTSVTENPNFKVMRWKSVRYSPNYTHSSYQNFLFDSGFINENGQMHNNIRVWYDAEHDLSPYGWSIVDYVVNDNPQEGIVVHKQVTNTVDMDNIKRMIVKDGDDYYNYQIYDPLNLKLPGEITKNVDYIDWADPAKYDDEYSDQLWLEDYVGKIWWDTSTARYYRYNDYGDSYGNIDVDYAKRYWGKLVPGSKVTIRQWKSSSTVPADISWFNTETYWDTGKNLSVTKYYYWSEIGVDTDELEYTVDEIRMFLETGGDTNKFIPINENKIVVNNTTLLKNEKLTFTVDLINRKDAERPHVDWKLLSRTGSMNIDKRFMDNLKDSIVGKKVNPLRHVIPYEGYDMYDNPEMTWKKDIVASDDQRIFDLDIIGGLHIENVVVILDGNIVDVTDFTITGTELTLSDSLTVTGGDILKLYRVDDFEDTDNLWFTDVQSARNNFASVVNEYMTRKMLSVEFPLNGDYITNGNGIFKSLDWAIHERYDGNILYQYLSKTRNFDMIDMFNNGTDSFKIELDDGDEYFFNYEGDLRLVRKDDAAIKLEYTDAFYSDDMTDIAKYYQNAYTVQTFELINMLYNHAEETFLRDIFFDMIDYMYTEKSYPEWIFKTSYIDLVMYNKPLRQYAIYQNDNYNDIIDYVNETKPYHTKIRKTDRIYPHSETITTTIDAKHTMDINIRFGDDSRYKDNVKDGIGDIEIIEGGLYPSENADIMDALGILKRTTEITSENGGFDTGEFEARMVESMILRVRDSSNQSLKNIFAYDMFGKGHMFSVTKTATVVSYDAEMRELEISQKSFRNAKDNTQWIIAIENENMEIEFVVYNKKSEYVLTLSERGLMSGESIDIQPGNKVYAFSAQTNIEAGLVSIY